MKPKVSVVVAAYNVEKYIERCLQSLANQTLKEIEILVINDGSKDRTEEIAKKFEEEDSRFKVITQENGGLSAARNTGIKNACGSYIAFLDGDDFVHPEMYKKLYNKIIQEKSDLVISGFYKVWEDNEFKEIKRKKFKVNKKLLKNDVLANFLTKHDEPFVVAWNKLYRLEIIRENEIYFENRAFFEDVGFIPRYLYYCKRVSVVEEELYYYVQRNGSITRSYNPVIEKSLRNTLNIINTFFWQGTYKKHLKAYELRLLLYKLNYSLKNGKDLDESINRILELTAYTKLLPFKHRIAIFLLHIGLYREIFKLLLGR
jgi:glycosyltransferase involved in cell wall biosynthesis